MNRHYGSPRDHERDIYESIYWLIQKNQGAWQSFCALCGLVGGLLTPVIGMLLISVTWFIHSQKAIAVLHVLSIVSFVLTLPLLFFAAHCLDLLERKPSGHSPLPQSQRDDLTPASSTKTKEAAGALRATLPMTTIVTSAAGQFSTPKSNVH